MRLCYARLVATREGTTATTDLAMTLGYRFGLRVVHFNDKALMSVIANTRPEEYVDLDLPRLLSPYDAVLDTPFPQIFPWLLAAFPNARVLHTVRDPQAWVASRLAHHSVDLGDGFHSTFEMGKVESS